MADPLLIAKGDNALYLLPGMSNRHGLVAGATGTGKTVTLQVMAEAFSRIGVPVFATDVKGDLSGISQSGNDNPKLQERVKRLGLTDFNLAGCPVTFWDVFGEQGHPVRPTILEMGPLLISRILNLNDTQSGVLALVFKIADDNGLVLLDLKDLQAMLQHVGDSAKDFQTQYGSISPASIGTIQRALTVLQQQGGDKFLGEPALNLDDLIQTDTNGRGVINILAADKLMASPQLYATFLLWMLSELFERLPKVGDPEKPKLVFLFDEAHLLFTDLPSTLQAKIERGIRLIRSKGVAVYFVTQNALDVPEVVLGQLGNRVRHALRAFTPKDQKAVRAAAPTFRTNPKLNFETVITELAVGEALVSFLDERGTPSVVDRALVCPLHSQIGPITPALGNIWRLRKSCRPRIGLRAAQKGKTQQSPAPAPGQTLVRESAVDQSSLQSRRWWRTMRGHGCRCNDEKRRAIDRQFRGTPDHPWSAGFDPRRKQPALKQSE